MTNSKAIWSPASSSVSSTQLFGKMKMDADQEGMMMDIFGLNGVRRQTDADGKGKPRCLAISHSLSTIPFSRRRNRNADVPFAAWVSMAEEPISRETWTGQSS